MIKEKTKMKPKRARNVQDKSRYYVTNEALMEELQNLY